MKKLVDPVIIVPGITATHLIDEYPVGHDNVWSLISKDYDRVALHPDNIKYEAVEPARISPGHIFEVAYKELTEELRYNLKEKEDLVVPVYPFGYDWRMPLEITEQKLGYFIDEVIGRTKLLRHYHEDGYAANPKVNLIGHSMGGLVIAGYLADKGKKALVNKVVTLATPFLGSFEAVMKLATGYADLGSSSSASRERETARITPSLYYLIPRFRNGITSDEGIPESLFEPAAWQPSITGSISEFIRIRGLPSKDVMKKSFLLFKKLLSQADAHGRKISSLVLKDVGLDEKRWMAVVGVNARTRVHLRIISKEGKPEFKISSEDRENYWEDRNPERRRLTGDGTVPFEGSVAPFLKEENLICVTPEDYGYWEAGDRALTVAGGFHGILPNMNMIHRLIVRFLKDQEDSRKNTWGRRAPGVKNWAPPINLTEAPAGKTPGGAFNQ